jgi:hypothetical protein
MAGLSLHCTRQLLLRTAEPLLQGVPLPLEALHLVLQGLQLCCRQLPLLRGLSCGGFSGGQPAGRWCCRQGCSSGVCLPLQLGCLLREAVQLQTAGMPLMQP